MNYGETYPQMILSLSTQIVFQLIRDMNEDYMKTFEKNGRTSTTLAILFI
ncbi:MAG: hypothetical protein ACM3TR_01655 [Caulobacteraceae bacterium]